MRKRWKLAAVVVCAALFTCACATKSNDGEEQVTTVNKTDENENEHQGNLDMVQPSAYGNVEGLNLEPGTYISIIGKSADGDYWKAVKEGAERAIKDINDMLDYKDEDKVKMVYSGPAAAHDVDEQVNILDEELARYPSALGISIIDSKSCDVQFDLATENDIPIVAYDSASNYQGIMAKISTNNTQAAVTAAANMAEVMKETGEVMIFAHDSKSITSKERVEAFIQEIEANHQEMKVGNTYYMDDFEELKKTIANEINAGAYSKETGEVLSEYVPQEEGALGSTEGQPDTGENIDSTDNTDAQQDKEQAESITDEDVIRYIFAKNPDAAGIYATASSAVMAAVEGCEQYEREEMTIVGFDGDKAEQEALKDGKVTGLVVQNPYGMGYATVVAAARSVLELGNEAEVNTGYVWVDEDNVDKKGVKRILY